MTFHEVTRVMLTSMDFFELRRTAARYSIAYQGVRRQKLIRDIERKIVAKSRPEIPLVAATISPETTASRSPEGAISARPVLTAKRNGPTSHINTFSARNALSRVESVK